LKFKKEKAPPVIGFLFIFNCPLKINKGGTFP